MYSNNTLLTEWSQSTLVLLTFSEDSLRVRFNFFEVQLIYNVVLVSGVQQRDSVIHTYISTFPDSFSL